MQNFAKLSVLQKASSEQKSENDYAVCHNGIQIRKMTVLEKSMYLWRFMYMYSTDQIRRLKVGKLNALWGWD